MTLRALKAKAATLSLNDRLELVDSIIQSLKQSARDSSWKFLEPRAESWHKQLYLKGSRLCASSLYGSTDSQVLAYACHQDRALLTRNCSDLKALHQANSSHFGS